MSKFKRALSALLAIAIVFGMFSCLAPIAAPVASAAGTSKIDSYASLNAEYGQNGNGFVYVGTEYYEADGQLTDYYVNAGDELTVRLYIKSNMYVGESYIISLYDNKFFDVKLAGGPGATTDANGYTNNYAQGARNSEHPIIKENNSPHTITSINIANVGWIKNTCGFTTTYLAENDLVQSNTATDITKSTVAYDCTSDEWIFEYYVKVKEGLADGTVGIVDSPVALWHASINPATKKHDARKRAYVPVYPEINPATRPDVTACKTMASQMDAGNLDTFINEDMYHEFTIGANPAAGGDTPSGGGAVEGTSKIDSYATLNATYGQDGNGFVYVGTEYYEADGKLTDYYVNAGDELTARLYIKSNMYVGESYIISLYDNKFFDVKLAGGPGATTDANGYTNNYAQGARNNEHPIIKENNSPHTITSINIANVGWIKNTCGFTSTYLAENDLVQSNTATDITKSTVAYDCTSDEWIFEYYVKVKEGLADGTVGIVDSPVALWHASINPSTNKHDARKRAYVPVFPTINPATRPDVTACKTMASQMDAGTLDTFINEDMYHEFTIGANPAGGVTPDEPSGPVEGTSKIDPYATLNATYGQNGDGFVYVGTEYYESNGKLTDYYVDAGEELTVRLYIKSNMYVGESYIISLYDNKFFDVKLAGGPGASLDTNGYTNNYAQGARNSEHPIIKENNSPHTITSINIANVGWIKNTCGFTATYLAENDLVQSNTATDITVSTVAYDCTSDEWVFEYYVKVKEGLADGTVGIVDSPVALWHASINTATGKHDARKRAYVPVFPTINPETRPDVTACKTMASQMDAGNLDTFINEDMYHEFTIGKAPAGGTYAATFKVDGETVSSANYATGAAIAAPEAPSKDGYVFLGWALEGTTAVLTFPQTMGSAAVTYVAIFQEVVKYTATFYVDGAVYGEVKSYAQGEAIVAPADPTKAGYTFTGWNPAVGNMGSANATFNATFAAKTYNVSFYKESTDSTAYQTLTVKYDGAYNLPAAPTKLGYNFVKWVDASGKDMPATHTVEADAKFYASWAAGTFDAIFKVDGDVYATVPTVFGQAIVAPADPTKTGYEFIGWTPEVGNMTAEGMTFTAQWQAAQIGVHFMDGENELAVLTGSFGSDIAAMSPNPSKDGFTFKGWQFANGDTADFPITLGSEAVYVYAVWEAKAYYIEFYAPTESDWLDGGTQLCGQPIVAPAAPTKSGYTFVGWFDAEGNPMPETVPAIDNQVYYGRYEATLYDAIFYVDGEEYHKFSGAYQSSITAPANPEKEGYTFNYWTKQGSTSRVNFPQRMPVGGVNYNAKFTVNKYTITYKVDGAVVKTETYEYGAAVTPYTYVPAEGVSFSGWGNQVPATMPAQNIEINGTTGVASYTVTFTIDGVEFTSFDVAYGAAITAPIAPAKEGYTFSGWDVPATMPAQNITLDATYTVNTYMVKFWLDDAMQNLYKEVELAYGAAIEYPVAPEVPGKEFVEWDTDLETVPANDVNIIAVFNDIYYYVEFVGEDGEIVADGEYLYNETIDEAPEAPVKEGYDFIGWFVDGVQATFPYAVTEEVTFEAVYDVQSLKVIYFVDGAQYDFDAYEFGAAITLRDTLVKEGYTFSGWQDAEGNAIELPATMPAEDIEVYGSFTVNQYPVTFNAGEGAFADGSKEITIDVDFGTVPVAPETPVLAGYGFAGWDPALAPVAVGGATYTAKFSAGMVNYTVETYTMGLDGQYGAPVVETKSGETDAEVSEAPVAAEGFTLDAQNSVLSGVVAADGSTVLKIYFIRNQYDLTISIDGVDSTVTYYYGADVAAQADPAKTGYTFIGWSEAIPATMPATDLTITANFQINQYTITFVDTGDVAYEAITQDYASAIADVADPVKTGYTFAGWDVEIPATMPAEDLTITAKWTINQYTITFVDTGDVAYEAITQDYATAIEAVADPVKTGHKFIGWDIAIPSTMPAENLTITAQWEVLFYDAKFIVDGKETVIPTAFGTIPAAPTPVKVGYTFTGWAEGEVVAMVVGGATYTAVFEANTYDAIFDAAGGAWADGATQKVVPTVFDTAIEAPAEEPKREAYIFAGWAPVVGNMTTEGITFVAQWTNDTSFCRVQEVTLVAPEALTTITKAAYSIKVMGAPVKVQIAGGEDYTFTWTYDRLDETVAGDLSEAGLVAIKRYTDGVEVGLDGAVNDSTYEIWTVVTMLSEGDYKVRAKVGYTTADWEEITTAYDYSVVFEDIEAVSDIIKSVTPAKEVIKRGTTDTITVVTDSSVSRLRLVMTKEDGSSLIVSYSPAATASCVVTDNGDGTETWALSMRFTYTGLADEQDQNWVVWYRTEGSSTWLETDKSADVKVVKYDQASSPAPEYAAFSIISVTAPENAVAGEFATVVVKTTSDVTKVRLGYNKKTSTYLTTSNNLEYVDNGDGTATWTISYRFANVGEQTWTAQCRGNKWSAATEFTFTVAE